MNYDDKVFMSVTLTKKMLKNKATKVFIIYVSYHHYHLTRIKIKGKLHGDICVNSKHFEKNKHFLDTTKSP